MSLFKDLTAEIKKLPCFSAMAKTTKIEQGCSQPCFYVQDDMHEYFVKRLNPETAEIEVKATTVAAQQLISPKIIFCSNQWLVTEYVQVCPSIELGARNATIASDCLNLMIRFHQVDVDLPKLNIEQTINTLSSAACVNDKQIDTVSTLRDRLLGSLVNQTVLVPCHGDVNYSNVLISSNRQWLIDYECACLAEPEYDIAMYMAINHISVDQVDSLLKFYQKETQNQHGLCDVKVTCYLDLSLLINSLWYFGKFKQNNDVNMRNNAFSQLARLTEQQNLAKSLYQQMR